MQMRCKGHAGRESGRENVAERKKLRMISLRQELIYRLDIEGPLQDSNGARSGERHQWWQMSHAKLEGPRIRASTPMAGIDWFSPDRHNFGPPHVRLHSGQVTARSFCLSIAASCRRPPHSALQSRTIARPIGATSI
jgi:hypothetical protein